MCPPCKSIGQMKLRSHSSPVSRAGFGQQLCVWPSVFVWDTRLRLSCLMDLSWSDNVPASMLKHMWAHWVFKTSRRAAAKHFKQVNPTCYPLVWHAGCQDWEKWEATGNGCFFDIKHFFIVFVSSNDLLIWSEITKARWLSGFNCHDVFSFNIFNHICFFGVLHSGLSQLHTYRMAHLIMPSLRMSSFVKKQSHSAHRFYKI